MNEGEPFRLAAMIGEHVCEQLLLYGAVWQKRLIGAARPAR
jgi:hypothetical protein